MKFDIITIFPEAFDSYFGASLMARAKSKGLIDIKIHNLRDYTLDAHKSVDDRPYGGGAGMVMRVDILTRALKKIAPKKSKKTKIVLLTPRGKQLNQSLVEKYNKNYNRIILIAGRYEGFDDRVKNLIDEELSIGDYILTGGELPAMIIVDAVARLSEGVVGKEQSLEEESFSKNSNRILEYPQYTRPEVWKHKGKKHQVPKVLLSGNHKEIKDWRQEQALKITKKRRPDLITKND